MAWFCNLGLSFLGNSSLFYEKGKHDHEGRKYIFLYDDLHFRPEGWNSFDDQYIPSYRAVSYMTGKELWQMNSKKTDSYSRDVDGSALVVNDTAYLALENALFTVFNPNPAFIELLDNKLDASTASLSKLLDMVKRSVQSDHYASSIYKKMSKQDLTEDQLITTLESISSLQSGHYKSEALKSFANKVKRSSESVKSAYRTAAKSINSDTYYSQAMKAID